MQIITKNIRWRALMETYQTAKFDRSRNNLSWDIVLKGPGAGTKKKEKKRIRKAKTIDLHLHADLIRKPKTIDLHLHADLKMHRNKWYYL